MGFSEIVNTIKSWFGRSDNSDLMLGDYFNKEILRQYKKTIKYINKGLKKSLRNRPYAHSEFKVRIENKDLRNAIIELYRKQGFKVKQPYFLDESHIVIIFDGWEE